MVITLVATWFHILGYGLDYINRTNRYEHHGYKEIWFTGVALLLLFYIITASSLRYVRIYYESLRTHYLYIVFYGVLFIHGKKM
eukprot:UN24817